MALQLRSFFYKTILLLIKYFKSIALYLFTNWYNLIDLK